MIIEGVQYEQDPNYSFPVWNPVEATKTEAVLYTDQITFISERPETVFIEEESDLIIMEQIETVRND